MIVPALAAYSRLTTWATIEVITALSGEIWDIDGQPGPTVPTFGTEPWRVGCSMRRVACWPGSSRHSGANPKVRTTRRPGWTFSFTKLPVGVADVRITFLGTKTASIGLAFNNFSPTVALAVPEVEVEVETMALFALGLSSFGLASFGLASLGLVARQRRPVTAARCPTR